MENEFTYEYLPIRSLTRNTLEHYDTKTKVDKDGKPVSLGFKYPNGAIKVRWLDRKEFYWETSTGKDTSKAGLFGRDKFAAGSHKYVTITEGEFDAQSLYQLLRSPIVSVQSSVTAGRDCTVDRAWLDSFERIYLAFDNDTAGSEAAKAVARLFDYNKVFVVRFDGLKDASDYLQRGRGDELINIWWNSKKFLPDTVVSSFATFRKILKEEPEIGIPYPFRQLNEMTYGIRRGESVLVTAQEGVGKTEFMLAIEHQLLRETNEPIGGIFLETPKRRHLQSLAGIELARPVHLPDSGVEPDQVAAAVEKLVGVDERLHLYSHFGSDDPAVLEDTIRFLVSSRGCPYILFDHISMAVSGLAGEDERKALDYLSTRLEMMVKELNFALIFVSHVNDFGQTRGSRYISKVADIRIDLSRDLDTGSNVTKLHVAKNRFCGITGPAGEYVFDPYMRRYSEVGANDNSPTMEGFNENVEGNSTAGELDLRSAA